MMWSSVRRMADPRTSAAWPRGQSGEQVGAAVISPNRQVCDPRLRRDDRPFWLWLRRHWSRWRAALVIVQPETVLRRHREPPPPPSTTAILRGHRESPPSSRLHRPGQALTAAHRRFSRAECPTMDRNQGMHHELRRLPRRPPGASPCCVPRDACGHPRAPDFRRVAITRLAMFSGSSRHVVNNGGDCTWNRTSNTASFVGLP